MAKKTKTNPTGAGRKKIIIDYGLIRKYASQGLSQRQISKAMGFSISFFQKTKKRNKEFKDAYERGVAEGLAEVTNSLYESATNGNIQSQIFFLKNRNPDRWQDKTEQVVEHINISNVLNSAKKRLIDITPQPKKLNKME